MNTFRPILVCLALTVTLAWLGSPSPASAQGRTDFLNVESPQVHSIEVARVDGHDYLLVCNTPDNSVEIWDTDETVPVAARMLARVPTGLRPVSVRWNPDLDRFYVANFLGDSVTSVILSAPGGPSTLSATVDRTTWVGDEPMDIAFHDFEETDPDGVTTIRHSLFLTHMTLDVWGWYDALTLDELNPGFAAFNAEVPKTADRDGDGMPDNIALKEPRAIATDCGNLVILGMKGGDTTDYDFDVYFADLVTGTTRDLGGLGSTNWNMAFTVGDDLLVVGGEAQNQVLRDEPVVAAAATGFVEHTLYYVENACDAQNTVVHRRDVNLEPTPVQPFPPPPQPNVRVVAKDRALAQLTSVVPFEPSEDVEKVFFTAFNSDRIGIIVPNLGQHPNWWPIRRMGVPVVAGSTNARSGPRSLALKSKNADQDQDPGHRLYSLNRLDNSVSIFDPVNEVWVGEFALSQDPTPSWVRAGQEFLYSAELSGNGFNSCASCHTDARTDGLAWDLGDPALPPAPIPPGLLDRPSFQIEFFPSDKQWMVTQSLQGLLNWEVEPVNQEWFTNAPYHWRGDRADFTAFNGAFVSLLGGSMLSPDEMTAYEVFINSIHYPGNPKQPLGREYSGDFGVDQFDPNATGAQLGLKLYHLISSDGFACVHCHSLPEGSNNRITEVISGSSPFGAHAQMANQPIETAAMRGLFQKEARLDKTGASDPFFSPITGLEGMAHTGFQVPNPAITNPQDFNALGSINGFNRFFFTSAFCPGHNPNDPLDDFCTNLVGLNQFVHELDWGVAPIVGVSYTVTPANTGAPLTTTAFNVLEGQSRVANGGVAVQAFLGGVQRGFWFDPTAPVQAYVEEPGGTVFTRAALIGLVSASRDRLMVISTPLGEERRVAAPTGTTVPIPGPSPASLLLEPMNTNTANVNVPQMTFFWAGATPQFGGAFSHSVRLLQHGLLQDAPAPHFGLPQIRHDAPRRFRVSGDNIRHGAQLEILYHCDESRDLPPDTSLRPDHPDQVELCELTLPIYPTDQVGTEESPRWETAVEAEHWLYYSLMLGGENAPGVSAALGDFGITIPEPPPVGTFSPVAWNWVWAQVRNLDGTLGAAGWQRVTIQ
ncbi:MAG: hypothetical protein SX243_25530 [Acidobacteriota bacterium]|nr:hypothetical protein [Acidobacteriota bacterium]